MTRKYNSRHGITLHLNYLKNYCTLYSTVGLERVDISSVVDRNSELFFLTPFEILTNKILIPNESLKFVLDKILALLLSKKFTILVDPQIIDMQREQDKKMNDKPSVEIFLGSKVSKGMPIPSPNERKYTPTQRALFFYQDAKRYRYKTVENAVFCDMSNYYGLYDTMTDPQKNWYFFWRSKVRKGEYPKTAITYINIYLYELINNIGTVDVHDGLDKISALWKNYRNDFPLIDDYLSKWVIDYSIVYNVTGVEKIFVDINPEWKTSDIDILLSSMENKLDLLGRFNVINFYSTYKITKSGYYLKCLDKEAVNKKVEAAFAAVEKYFLDKFSYSICDKYSPYYSTRTVQAPFAGALYAGTKIIDIKYKSYNGNPDFKNFVAQIVRYTEKILRQQDSYRSPLQKVDLSDNIKSIIDSELNSVAFQKQKEKQKQEKIVIDIEKINNLIKDSEEMQRLLIDENTYENETIMCAPVVESRFENLKSEKPLGGDNELEEFFSLLTGYRLRVMEILIEGKDFGRINETAVLNNTIASQIFDDINELALETINDIIIDTASDVPEIIEQYADGCAQWLSK